MTHSEITDLCALLILSGILIPVSVTDIRKRIIPNRYPILLLVFGTGSGLLRIFWAGEDWRTVLFYTAAGFVMAALLCAVCRWIVKQGIGMGDVKLLMGLGWYMGVRDFPIMLAVSSLLSFACSAFLMIRKKVTKESFLPFAPFLCIGSVGVSLIELLLEVRA